jgi:hypothetical protein
MKPALVFCFLMCAAALTAQPAAQAPAPAPLLPQQFAGWQLKDTVTKSADPAAADQTNAPVLKEYGFQRLEKATYTRDDGRKLDIKAAAFDDASGAYGAFTYYKSPAMLNEKIGGQASSLNTRVLFYQGNILVDVVFDKLSVMSAAELRELAGLLPQPPPNARNLPPLLNYIPKQTHQSTAKYIMGPVTLDRVGSPLPSAMVDFKLRAEVVIEKYPVNAGDATLMLIYYPTPQIAIEKLRQIDAAHQVNSRPQAGVVPILEVGPFFDRRTGPIIVIAAGPLSQAEARSLLSSISYEADVTWNQNTYLSKKNNVANFLVNAILLCGIVIGLSLVAGLGFGGLRILLKSLFPNRVFDRPEDMEIISLHLGDQRRTGPAETVSHSIKGS